MLTGEETLVVGAADSGSSTRGECPTSEPPVSLQVVVPGEDESGSPVDISSLTDRERKQRSKALDLAVEVTNTLRKITRDNPGRVEAYQIVRNWIETNGPPVTAEPVPTACPSTAELKGALVSIDQVRGLLNRIKNTKVAFRSANDVLAMVKQLRSVADRLVSDMQIASSSTAVA